MGEIGLNLYALFAMRGDQTKLGLFFLSFLGTFWVGWGDQRGEMGTAMGAAVKPSDGCKKRVYRA